MNTDFSSTKTTALGSIAISFLAVLLTAGCQDAPHS